MEQFEQRLQSLSDTPTIVPHADKVWEKIRQIGFPRRKEEAYLQYPLPILEDILSEKVSGITKAAVAMECEDNHILLQNGTWLKERSSFQGIYVYSLQEAYQTYGIYLERRRQELMKEKDPFLLSHLAAPSQGLFLYLPANKKVEIPLEILSSITTQAISTVYLHMGEGSSLQLYLDSYAEPEKSLSNLFLDITLENKASLQLIDKTSASNSAIFHFVRARLKKEASLDAQILSTGGIGNRIDYKVTIEESGADAKLQGLTLLSKEEIAHIHTEICHKAEEATSKQIFRSIVEDKGQYRFAGKIYVHPEAQQTDSHQLCENLLLSDKARAFVQPNLEIFADDVKASHGATISKLEDPALFYLKSRGISEKEAKKLLIKGFADKALSSVWLPSVRSQFSLEG